MSITFTVVVEFFRRARYGTAHIQVYKQTHVMHHASRNFEDNLHVGLM